MSAQEEGGGHHGHAHYPPAPVGRRLHPRKESAETFCFILEIKKTIICFLSKLVTGLIVVLELLSDGICQIGRIEQVVYKHVFDGLKR